MVYYVVYGIDSENTEFEKSQDAVRYYTLMREIYHINKKEYEFYLNHNEEEEERGN